MTSIYTNKIILLCTISIYTNKIILLCTIYGTRPPQILLKIGIIHIEKIIHFFGRGGGSSEKNSGPVKINILWATASCHFYGPRFRR